ncbi:hypothetical protein M407DRAFT_240926 [Tulasnella calospora MUT 4182]|uniref:Uncharacterized protein n=1 Tax=Tulasnella calospora MUT 4182 TaxID=1051891 RepID=A0A0C3MJB7_9AGAM|nr:hypothetical protein M407DRAFT_240926 [Tulasnella calospora MUT 4182]
MARFGVTRRLEWSQHTRSRPGMIELGYMSEAEQGHADNSSSFRGLTSLLIAH